MKNQRFWQDQIFSQEIQNGASAMQVAPWVAQFLLSRQFRTLNDLGSLDSLGVISDPYELPDMDRAVSVIRHFLSSQRPIRVYGDYDADGVTATALMVRALRALSATSPIDYYIPNRFDEGYGLNPEAVLKSHQDGIGLLITVDCGSSSPEAADLARSLGLALVMTDHHALPERAPEVDALVNPERTPTPDRFSGAGVALQVVRALWQNEPPDVLFAIAAIGTVADVVPLTGNNRRIVARGLSALQRGVVPGVNALYELTGRDVTRASAEDLGFLVGPRLNAAGRMGDADRAVRLLLADDQSLATDEARELDALNQERRRIEADIIRQAWVALPHDSQGHLYPFTVIAGQGWHQGVIGIVASRFREWLKRPVAVVAWDGSQGKGSARGVPQWNLIQHLRRSSHIFSRLGGHPGAAGFSLSFQASDLLSAQLSEGLPKEVIAQQYLDQHVDVQLAAHQTPTNLPREVEQFRPYGHQFAEPLFLINGVVKSARVMGGDGSHLSLELASHPIRAVGFGLGIFQKGLVEGVPVRFAATLKTQWYRGRESFEWMIQELEAPFPMGERPIFRGRPQAANHNVVWVVNSDKGVRTWAEHCGGQAYVFSRPWGELREIEEGCRLGAFEQVVVSQWRPWPRLAGWADLVIWRCPPRHAIRLQQSASFLQDSGGLWLDYEEQEVALTRRKARFLSLNRERLARHWRQWQVGRVGLMPGRAVFRELGLHPNHITEGERRPLTLSYLYQMALTESQWDASQPFVGIVAREEEMDGLG